jgi:hypothetical protein
MGKRKFPTNLIKQSQTLLSGLSQITPAPTITGITATSFTTDVAAATTLEKLITDLEAQLNDKRNLRDAQFAALWDKAKRIRNSIKGSYGDDSPQYDLVGGTRLSDRKPYRRKTTG